MQKLSLATKEAIVQQALNRGTKPLELIARENNIGYSTLQKWIRKVSQGQPLTRASKSKHGANVRSQTEQFNHILATHNLDEVSLGKYCRKHGIYSHQLKTWRESFMSSPQKTKNPNQSLELKQLRDENKRLQKDLRRKEKALAEASALLIMKKKADLIWGVNEGD